MREEEPCGGDDKQNNLTLGRVPEYAVWLRALESTLVRLKQRTA